MGETSMMVDLWLEVVRYRPCQLKLTCLVFSSRGSIPRRVFIESALNQSVHTPARTLVLIVLTLPFVTRFPVAHSMTQ